MVMRLVRDDPSVEDDFLDNPASPAADRTGGEIDGAMLTPDHLDAEEPTPTGGDPELEEGHGEPDGAVESAADAAARQASEDAAEAESGEDETFDPRVLEALLLSTHHPLTPARLAELLEIGSAKSLRTAIEDLNEQYQATARSFRIEQVAGGYQILTLPEFGDAIKRLHQKEADAKLTKAALETLAIIAYKQPILRADVEAIRGVACGETIRSLMEKHLVKIAGRAEEPGRPILYGTTRRFLELFGLNSTKDLPQSPELIAKQQTQG